MNTIKTRRTFIQIVPIAGISFLAGCSKQEAPAPATPAPTPPASTAQAPAAPATPGPPPVAAPVAAAPIAAPAPAPAPATAAATGGMVDEKDSQAISLGFVSVAANADKAKFKTWAEGQQCSACLLFQGAAGAATGGCGIFVGRQVPAKGWCSAFNKKA